MASPASISSAREHIEEIRRARFGIGESAPGHEALELFCDARRLASCLFTFNPIYELIKNAEDNDYANGSIPSLEFVITPNDITCTGALETLLVFNNEVGFSEENIDAICSIGQSTKRGRRSEGFIGEKGIGFKSVFLISEQPYIFSNGYQIRFTEVPNQNCPIYIVPEWVDSSPSISEIQQEYDPGKCLPKTILVLPLREDKVDFVKKQVAELRLECLLFLFKLQHISVWVKRTPLSPRRLSMSRETTPIATHLRDTESCIVKLSMWNGLVDNESMKFYLFSERFLVESQHKVVTLAFPLGNRFNHGGIFSYLPTMTMTNFPFHIQSDSMLSPFGRIDFANKWNIGILRCVPIAFADAFTAFMYAASPSDAALEAFEYLPVVAPGLEAPGVLDWITHSIRDKMKNMPIVPCETFGQDKPSMLLPGEVRRIFPAFRYLLYELNRGGKACLDGMKCEEKLVLHSSLDKEHYKRAMNFIGVDDVGSDPDWYGRCIQNCNLLSHCGDDDYMQLLCFLGENWNSFRNSIVADMPILRYLANDKVELCSFPAAKRNKIKILIATSLLEHAWLNEWQKRFDFPSNIFLLPNVVQEDIMHHQQKYFLSAWLYLYANVSLANVRDYSFLLVEFLRENMNYDVLLRLPHFLHESRINNFISEAEVSYICRQMPIIDGSGRVHVERNQTLVPALESKWMKLFCSNPFTGEKYIALGTVYEQIPGVENIMSYLCKYTNALDLPELVPPNVVLQIASSELSAEQAFLLLEWLNCLREKGANLGDCFIGSISNGKWMKTSFGFIAPTHCYLSSSVVFADLAPIDEEFYGDKLWSYIDELKFIGVKCKLAAEVEE